jgi:hypothetical protein
MISSSAALPNSYDYSEVGRSLLVAIVVSYAGFDLAGPLAAVTTSGSAALRWLPEGSSSPLTVAILKQTVTKTVIFEETCSRRR